MTRLLILLWLTLGVCFAQQFALPDSDTSIGSDYVEVVGNDNGSAWDEIDEGFGSGRGSGSGPDDSTTYWRDENPGNVDRIQLHVSTVTDPVSSSNHISRWRLKKDASAGRQVDVSEMILWQDNNTARCTETSEPTNIDENWQTHAYTCSGAEADAIALYSDMHISIGFSETGGGAPRAGDITAMEFEVPSVGGATDDTITIFIGMMLAWFGLSL